MSLAAARKNRLEPTLCLISDSSSCDADIYVHCPCDACLSVAQMEAEILLAQERVLTLKKSLVSLKSEVNNRHDPVSRLPAELVSEIFKFYCTDRYGFSVEKPLIIGKVCKRWREVTLVTPQLWANIQIRAHINKPYDLDVATEWLSRSRSLPLTLDIEFDMDYSTEPPPEDNCFLPLIHLLRSHSIRWSDITITTNWETHIIPPLFANLENTPSNFRALTLETARHETGWTSDTLLFPETLEAHYGSSTIGFPLGWDRLSSLTSSFGAEALYLDEILRIIKNAPVLTDCTITSKTMDLELDEPIFNFQDAPIVSHSITNLETGSPWHLSENLLDFLILPSLRTIRYNYECHSAEDTDLIILKNFLDRSSPPLDEFHLTITPYTPNYVNIWRHEDVPLTSLSFDASELDGSESVEGCIKRTNDFMALLLATLDDGGLIKLRKLYFSSPITPEFWSSLCNIIQKFVQIRSSDAVLNDLTDAQSRRFAGELHSVVIYPMNLTESTRFGRAPVCMEATVYSRLLEMERSGVDIRIIPDTFRFGELSFHQLDVNALPTTSSSCIGDSSGTYSD